MSVRDNVVVFRSTEEERSKLILQIGTNNKDTALQAVELLQDHVYGVDVNMGCPMKFSTSGGMGAALMKQPLHA